MRPPVPAPSALIVVRPPKNQKCSPSPGARAMGARAPFGVFVAVSAVCMEDMPGSLISATGVNHPPRRGICPARHARLTRMDWKVERLIEEIDLLGSRGLPREEFFAELSARLRKAIDNDASCWHTLDPSTRLLPSDPPKYPTERRVFAPDEAPAAGELIVRSEYMGADVNTFAGLAKRRGRGARPAAAPPAGPPRRAG